MQSKEMLKTTLETCHGMVIRLIEDMKDAPLTFPTPNGGCHPLWIVGHLAFSEGQLIRDWMLGESNPLAEWQEMFGIGTVPTAAAANYPPYAELMAKFQQAHEDTLALLDSMSEEDLDTPTKNAPPDYEKYFPTYRQTFLMTALHRMMHRGQAADARRAAGRGRLGP